MSIYLSLFVCILGLVLYLVLNNPSPPSTPPGTLQQKFSVVGLHMFWVGLLVFLLKNGPAAFNIFK